MTKTKKIKNCLMTVRVETEFKSAYLQFSKNNGYSYSKRLRILMEKDMGGKLKIK